MSLDKMLQHCYLVYNEKQNSQLYVCQNVFYFVHDKLSIYDFQMHEKTVLQMEAIVL